MYLRFQQCTQCLGGALDTCFQTGVGDGPGVPDADFVLYVSALEIFSCGPTSGTIAFAATCEMEQTLDR